MRRTRSAKRLKVEEGDGALERCDSFAAAVFPLLLDDNDQIDRYGSTSTKRAVRVPRRAAESSILGSHVDAHVRAAAKVAHDSRNVPS